MRCKLWVGVIIVGVLCAGRGQAAMRVALISTGPEKETGPVVALAEARLSEDSRVELLDRNTIGKILAEQKLSLSGLVDTEQAVAVGKLLRVEAFAVLESLGENEPPALVVFDGYSGARLVDVELPRDDAQGEVEAIARGVEKAREKLAAIAGGMHGRTICLLAVRNADLPRQMDGVCDAVAMLLQRRLLASDDICLLERKRLEAINRERQLPTSRPASAILASVVCVELEFSRPASGAGITATAILSDAQGKPLAKPSVTLAKEDVVKLASGLSAGIADALQVVPAGIEADANKEARRFEREATFLLVHQEVEEGLQSSQAAYALNPDDPAYSWQVAFALLRHAGDVSRAGGRDVEAMELATRAMEIRDSRLKSLQEKNPGDSRLGMSPDNQTGDTIAALLERADSTALSGNAAVSTAAGELGEAYLQFMGDWLAFSEAASAGDARLLSRHMEFVRLNRVVAVMGLASRDSGQYVEEVTGLYLRYFALVGKLDRRAGLPLYLMAGHELGNTDFHGGVKQSVQNLQLQPSDIERIDQLFSLLEKSDDPGIRFYGLRDRLLFDKSGGQPSPADCQAIYDKARQAARDAMDDADLAAVDRRGFSRNQIYTDALDLLAALRRPGQATLAERQDWYDFMFARHEIPLGAVTNLGWLRKGEITDAEAAGFLKRLNAEADSSQEKFLGCSAEEARVKLAEQMQDLSDVVPQIQDGTLVAKTLLQAGRDTGIDAIEQVVPGDGVAWVIVSVRNNGQRALQAMRVPLDGGKAETVGAIPSKAAVNDACLDGQRLFVATEQGIEIFPLHGGPVSSLTQEDGLPTSAVQSVAVLDDVIYAGLKDKGYLIAYDIKARHCRVLASSRRKEKLSPFDDCISFTIPRIDPDPSAGRILLVQYCPGREPQNGLWAMDSHSGEFKQLLKLNFDYSAQVGGSRMLPDGRMLVFSYNWALAFDVRRETSQVLFAAGDVGPEMVRGLPAFRFNRQVGGPFSLVEKELWAGKPMCHIEGGESRVQEIALPSTGGGGNALWIEPLPGGEKVLVGNAQGLWLVSYAAAGASSQPAGQGDR